MKDMTTLFEPLSVALAHFVAFVSGQIIDDDYVAWPQRRHQASLQVFDEDRTVHRAINDEGGGKAIEPQPSHKGHGLPMAPGNAADHTTPALGASVKPRHLGRCAGLIDEDQLGRIKSRLIVLPALAGLGHVRPLLLGRAHAFF